MNTLRAVRGSVAASVVAAAVALGATPAATASAATAPRPPARSVDRARLVLGCTFTPVDTVDAAFDTVSVRDDHTVFAAGRAPAGGGLAWMLTPFGIDGLSWATRQSGPVLVDTAADGSTVVAGAAALRVRTATGWSRAALPAPGNARSVAALPGDGAVVLLADGRVHRRTTAGWTRLPALPGTVLAVAAPTGRPAALTTETTASGPRLRAWTLVAGRWTAGRAVVASGLGAPTVASTRWASAADGGVVALNGPTGAQALVDLAHGTVLRRDVLAVTDTVTAARRLPDGRTLLAHAAPARGDAPERGSLSILTGRLVVPVSGSHGDPVVGLAVAPGARRVVVTVRQADLGAGDVATSLAMCR